MLLQMALRLVLQPSHASQKDYSRSMEEGATHAESKPIDGGWIFPRQGRSLKDSEVPPLVRRQKVFKDTPIPREPPTGRAVSP